MNNLSLQRPSRNIPKGRETLHLPSFVRTASDEKFLEELATKSGLSSTEKDFVAMWRSRRYRMTDGDRRCFGHMVQIHLGVRL